MIQITATGIVTEVVERTIERNGEERAMTVVKFRVGVRKRQSDGSYKSEGRFCEAVAFGKTAEIWARRFSKDLPVEATGELEVDTFARQDGTIGITYKVLGYDGGPPHLNWAPTPRPQEDF